jgi:chemotaxis response regulator CheB
LSSHAIMKVFIIISNETHSKSRLLSMVSALANIEATGLADSLVDAIDIIRKHYPNAVIVDSETMEEKGRDRLISVLENADSFIVIPSPLHIKKKCIYIGIEVPSDRQKVWIWNEIGKTLRECEALAAN